MGPMYPNLIIVGAGRAGTTSLFKYLGMHPKICASSKKEIGFFTPLLWGGDIPPLNIYARYFQQCKHSDVRYKYFLEASPGYFAGAQKVVQGIIDHLEIEDVIPILMLREPVSRVVSYYHYQKSRVHIPVEMDFKKFVAESLIIAEKDNWLWDERHFWGVKESMYSNYIQSWHDVFGNKLQVVFFDDLLRHPGRVMNKLCDVLELPDDMYSNFNFYKENPSFAHKNSALQKIALFANEKTQSIWMRYPGIKQKMREIYYKINARPKDAVNNETIAFLQTFFRPYNKKLSKLLKSYGKKDLPDWL